MGDVGGGRGGLKSLLREALGRPEALEYRCIDVTPSKECEKFDGISIGEEAKSYDVVVFNYVLHHAGDSTIGLLEGARNTARHFVVIQEDIKSANRRPQQLMNEHEWAGTYRGHKEWTKLFELLGMSVSYE